MPAKTIKKKPIATKKPVRARKSPPTTPNRAQRPLMKEVQAVLSSLEQMSTQRDRENLPRFGITASKAFGVSMANIQVLAKLMN